MSVPTVTMTTSVWSTASRRLPKKKSLDETIDAYAQHLLVRSAGRNDYIDDALGSYVTSCLRNSIQSFSNSENVTDLPEYEPLCELIQEHLHEMDAASVTVLLQQIMNAIFHRHIPEEEEEDHRIPSSSILGRATPSMAPPTMIPNVISPYAAALLPENLLQEEEDEVRISEDSIETDSVAALRSTLLHNSNLSSHVPPPPGLIHSPLPTFSTESATKKKHDTAATPDDTVIPTVYDPSPPEEKNETAPRTPASDRRTAYWAQLEQQRSEFQVADRLYRAGGFSHAAATAAAQLARGNGPIAQYILQQAAAQVPVCRHLLADGCYRADCSFSHDIQNHTCLFWLKSQCGKGEGQCRFLHGLSEVLLDALPDAYRSLGIDDDDWEDDDDFDEQPVLVVPTSQHSFANIASQGYHARQSFPEFCAASKEPSPKPAPRIPIPQHLWYAQRDPSAFGIADPLERYYAVMAASVKERNVMDLHYQSLQTFAVVLDALLPEQLAQCGEGEGVWIITGTGHHVGGHQKRHVSTLEGAVWEYLQQQGYATDPRYRLAQGRDRNGQGGALYIQKS